MKNYRLSGIALLIALLSLGGCAQQSETQKKQIRESVDKVIKPLIEEYQVPGMAVAVTVKGKKYFFNYGVKSVASKQPVSNKTFFVIGAITQTFATTLASYFHIKKQLSWSDPLSAYLPSLEGTPAGKVSLLNLATHTAGFPLNLPRRVRNERQIVQYAAKWKPSYLPVGSRRVYSNAGIGLLGLALAPRSEADYEKLLQRTVLNPIGMTNTYFYVPVKDLKRFARGYSQDNAPVRRPRNIVLPAAFGLKSTSADLIRYIQANLGELTLETTLKQALLATHTAYYKTPDGLMQDLAWEQYPFSGDVNKLMKAHSASYMNAPATAINPPLAPQQNVLINKTGTGRHGSFSSYVGFVPAQKAGVVILANKVIPKYQRVRAGYDILLALSEKKNS